MGREIIASLAWASNFARTCAAKFPSHADQEDLQSAGLLAYIRAASRYKSRFGASFRGYCATRIRGAVLDEMRHWTWAPRSVLRDRRRLREARSALNGRLLREPTREELASELGVAVPEFESFEVQAEYRQVVSLSEATPGDYGDDFVSLADRIPDANVASPCQDVLTADDRQVLLNAIRRLPKTQATVIVLHYMKNIPLREIASVLCVTPSRVTQVHHQALERLRRSCQAPEGSARRSPNPTGGAAAF